MAQLGKMMKTVALRQAETKVASETTENNQLRHNGTAYRNNRLFTRQGTADSQGFSSSNLCRVGDEIVARGIKFKWWLSNKADRPNVMYNIYVFYYNTLETPTDSTFWRGTDGTGATMNRMLDQPNPERVKVLKKLTVKPGAQFYEPAPDGKEHSYFRECWLPLNNKKIVYRRDSTGVPKLQDIGFAIVAYDSYGTLVSDNIASYAYSTTLYFKDP